MTSVCEEARCRFNDRISTCQTMSSRSGAPATVPRLTESERERPGEGVTMKKTTSLETKRMDGRAWKDSSSRKHVRAE